MENILKVFWAVLSVWMIVLSIYLTHYLHYAQFKLSLYKKSFKGNKKAKDGISPLKTLLLTLAGRIGVGSIAGIALAIYIGGAGTIFWVWVISLLTLPLAYGESILGSLYKKKFGKEYIGGPSYYIRDGLKNNKLASLYAILILLSFIFGFLGIQVNTITKAATIVFPLSKFAVGVLIAVLTFFIVIGDVFKIASATGKIVPFMLLFYLGLCTYVISIHIDKVPQMLFQIIESAFTLRPFFSGFLYTLIIGIQRGIFSSEAGLGTGSITSAASNSMNPKKDGYIQMLGVSVTALVVCTITAFIILLSPYQELQILDVNGIEVASHAFGYHFSNLGIFLMFLFIFLCSFSTILTGYYDSLISLRFLLKKHYKIQKFALISITLLMILFSSFLSSKFMWNMVDLFVGILMAINLHALYALKGKILKINASSLEENL
jgi:AGCS family alanine or glycine:cation symporter